MSFNDYEETLGLAAYTAYREASDKRVKWDDNSWGVKEAWVKAALAVRDLLDDENETRYGDAPPDSDDKGLTPNPDAITATQIQTPAPDTRLDERDESSTG